MSTKALRGASSENVEVLVQAIDAFVAASNPNAKPIIWRKLSGRLASAYDRQPGQ